MDPLELTLDYQYTDFVHFCRTTMRRNWKQFGWLPLFGLMPFLLGEGLGAAILTGLLWAVLMSAFMLLTCPYLQARTLHRTMTALGTRPILIRFDETGIRSDNNGLQTQLAWDGFGEVVETNRALMIRIGKNGGFFLLPHRLLDDAQYAAVNQWLARQSLQRPDSEQSAVSAGSASDR